MIKGEKITLSIVLVLLILFFVASKLINLPSFTIPFLLSFFDIILVIWFLSLKGSRNLLLYIYFLYGILTLKLPIIYFIMVYSSDEVIAFYNYSGVSVNDMISANIFILSFDLLLIFFLFLFNYKKSNTKVSLYNYYPIKYNKNVIILLLVGISILSKIYLISTGIWFFYEMNDIDFKQYQFAGLANNLEKLDFLVLLYYVYKYKVKSINKQDYLFFYIILSISLLFAFISTSKGRILTLFFPIILMVIYSPKRLKGFALLFVSLIFMNSFFKFMMYVRLNNEKSITSLIQEFGNEVDSQHYIYEVIREDRFMTRLEYQTIIARVINKYKNNSPKEEYGYSQNIIGVIPRFLWNDKPELGLDTNRIGYELGILNERDDYTTIGITPIGVSYYFFGYLGIIFIAFFTAILLIINLKLINENYWIGFILSIMVALQLARNGTFLNIVPALIQTYLIFTIFGLLLNDKKLK